MYKVYLSISDLGLEGISVIEGKVRISQLLLQGNTLYVNRTNENAASQDTMAGMHGTTLI